MKHIALENSEFSLIKRLVFNEIGISLNDTKRSMIENRLFKRLKHYDLENYASYLKIVQLSNYEKTEFLNCISTNETSFFREAQHFEFLKKLSSEKKHLRVWSAAASFGAEAYSIAMMLDAHCKVWEVFASDINTNVLNIAKQGLYQITLIEKIPWFYREKYCLIGRNDYEGKFLVERALINNMIFQTNNLLYQNEKLGKFDVVFLRNVLLYFSDETKERVICNVIANLKVGGYLIIGVTEHFSEERFGCLTFIENGIYKKV